MPSTRRSKKLKTRISTNLPQSIPFSALPTEIITSIFSNMHQYKRSDLFNFIQVSRTWYSVFIPHLYQRLKVDGNNMRKIFGGLDIPFVDKKDREYYTYIRYEEHSFSDEQEADDDGNEDEDEDEDNTTRSTRQSIAKKTESISNKGKRNQTENQGWTFGFRPEDISKRNLKNLQCVKSLIVDWEAATAIATIIKNERVESPTDTSPFSDLETVAFGIEFLTSDGFYPDGARGETFLEPNWVIRHLATLHPKHVCANWYASLKFHPADSGFTTYLGFLIGNYQLDSFTWHGASSSTLTPRWPEQISNLRIFHSDCGDVDQMGYANYGRVSESCRCGSRLSSECIRASGQATRRKEKVELETINLTCLGEVDDKHIRERKHIDHDYPGSTFTTFSCSRKSKKQNKEKTFKITVTSKRNAEGCVCCGKK